ncbi:hypothetical protein GCK72_005152 [Caenorhabditis remanei]|uniref:procollagen-lysine 5-dioxygenase n=1 Tax=Caenorhabditis remanei TaxID=31234 RepID=A0A6A5HBR2_CAERE|nr:hypothetical protein GCK72_005152 [Caenorhabditis remanei]KAF1765200.1 hypothetical protein GCK72_005152 [Caenorhabditis remanei]
MRVLPLLPFFLIPVILATTITDLPELVVVTVATENTDGLKRLLESAKAFDIKIEVLALGEKWNGGDTRVEQGGGQKIRILSEWIEKYKDASDTMIMFVDAYDVVFNADATTILRKFFEHYSEKRLLFGAEPFCWPDQTLAPDYPIVEFGKRFLNSGLFMGYGPEVYKILKLKPVEDKDDDQLYYTMIYLDDKLRKELKMDLDSMSKIFQNLNGVIEDVELQFKDDGTPEAYNAAYNTKPLIIHGNGPSKSHLNYLGNYLGNRWNSELGCRNCGQEEEKETADDDLPVIALNLFISKPIPFIEEVLQKVSEFDYPKNKIALYIYNNQPFSIKNIQDFLKEHGKSYYTKRVINGVTEIGEREARNEAIEWDKQRNVEYGFFMDADAYFTDSKIVKDLVHHSKTYDVGIIAPMVGQPGKLFTNFWGAIAANGYYARSEDYMAIVKGNRVGYWNVPFITSAVLLNKEKLIAMKDSFSYNKNLDPDMSMCQFARDHGHFMYIDNEKSYGYLIVSDEFSETVTQGKWHPEMWQIFENRELWEARYIHPGYHKIMEPDHIVDQACPDVYDYPLMSERFCAELIEEMEGFGRWSDGSNNDKRLAGGYENVPTRDIHMNQVGFERQWLYFLDTYVRPVQEKTFIGYYHQPVESNMMFVVRYKPEEQASLRPHHDASTFSIDIALNKKGRDYEGGGVRYIRYNCTVQADEVGYAMMFPGRLTHMHEGLATTKGTRYIMVSFINP